VSGIWGLGRKRKLLSRRVAISAICEQSETTDREVMVHRNVPDIPLPMPMEAKGRLSEPYVGRESVAAGECRVSEPGLPITLSFLRPTHMVVAYPPFHPPRIRKLNMVNIAMLGTEIHSTVPSS
jgi:hypothetical protein